MRRLACPVLLILHLLSLTIGQNFNLQPMGLFRWVTPIPNSGQIVLPTASPALSFLQLVGRPQVDNALPPGVDAASIAAQEAAILSFIGSCKRQTLLAGLRCPCSGHGARCADPLSVCNLENKCVCDGRLGYVDRTGTKCVGYATATASTTTTTRTTTTTTKPTTTTSTTTSTTTDPTIVYTIFKPQEAEDPCPLIPAIIISASRPIEFRNMGYPGTTNVELECDVEEFKPPAGKKLKVDFLEFKLDSTATTSGDCQYPHIALNGPRYEAYCTGGRPPPATVIFDTDIAVGLGFDVFSLNGPYKFNIRFSVVD